MNHRVVLAVGGNSLIRAKDKQSFADQLAAVAETCRQIADIVEAGHEVVITHGNGPQVGFLLIRSHLSRNRLPEIPLDACNALTQAEIGYMIQQALGNELSRRGLNRQGMKPQMNTDEHRCPDGTDRQEEGEPQRHREYEAKSQEPKAKGQILSGVRGVVTVVTQVVVDPNDPAFQNPSKPVGPFYTKGEAALLQKDLGWTMREDAGRGFRRLVPSPRPVEVVEQQETRQLLEAGFVVIACGGGGIPVVRENGGLRGVAAVIDKDLASSLLAQGIGAGTLVMSTAVEQVYLDYGRPNQRPLGSVKAMEMREYLAAGQFPEGSMGPKVEAALEFLEEHGREKPQMNTDEHRCEGKAEGRKTADRGRNAGEAPRRVVVITDPEHVTAAMRGEAGTRIVP